MLKKEEKKKTPAWVWILIGILILIILLLLLFKPWAWFMVLFGSKYEDYPNEETPQIPNYTEEQPISSPPPYEIPEQPEQPSIPEPEEREYKTSDKLTEITFTRNFHSVNGDQIIDVKQTIEVSGYLQEVPLTQTTISKVIDRAYIFKDGKLEWDIFGNEQEGDTDDGSCIITWTVDDQGSSTPDSNGKLQGLSTGDMAAMSYAESGFDTFEPEIELILKAHVTMLEVQDIKVSGEHTICNEKTESTVLTQDYTSLISLPLIIKGNPDTTSSFTGSFSVEYDSFDELPGDAFMKNGIAGVPLDVEQTFDEEDNWQVDYKVFMP